MSYEQLVNKPGSRDFREVTRTGQLDQVTGGHLPEVDPAVAIALAGLFFDPCNLGAKAV
jgi:hypothetical protein